MSTFTGWATALNTVTTTTGTSGTISPIGEFPGTFCSVYTHNTTTLATITGNSNPFAVNADGSFAFVGINSSYDLIFSLTLPAVTTPVVAAPPVGPFSVDQPPFSAAGDGVTNDSGPILAAIAAAVAAGGGTVVLGPYAYSIGTTTIVIPDTVNVLGVGDATSLLYAGTGSAVRLSASQFATIGYFVVRTSNDAASAIEAGTATRQSLLTNCYVIGTNAATTTGAGFYLNAISGFSGGLTILNCNATGYKFGVKFTSVNTSTDTWTCVDITNLWAAGRAAGVIAGSCGISFDANTNGIGTKWRGGTIEFFATGVKHVAGGFGGDVACDFEGNTADVSVGAGFIGRITIAPTGVQTIPGSIAFFTDNVADIGASVSPRARTGYFGTSVAIGTNPANTGALRLPNASSAAGQIIARKNNGLADISLLQLFTDDQIYMGQTGVSVSPNNDNAQALGQTTQRWSQLFLGSYLEGAEIVAPAVGPANSYRLFAVDSGAGKTILKVQFATGAAQTIATEP